MSISETQIDQYGYRAGDRVIVKGPDATVPVTLLKLVAPGGFIDIWITQFEAEAPAGIVYSTMKIVDANYCDRWQLDHRYIGVQFIYDVHPQKIIGRQPKQFCDVCQARKNR